MKLNPKKKSTTSSCYSFRDSPQIWQCSALWGPLWLGRRRSPSHRFGTEWDRTQWPGCGGSSDLAQRNAARWSTNSENKPSEHKHTKSVTSIVGVYWSLTSRGGWWGLVVWPCWREAVCPIEPCSLRFSYFHPVRLENVKEKAEKSQGAKLWRERK